MTLKIGIIGGSGLDDPKILSNFEEVNPDTPYGKPSSKITIGKIGEIEVAILARHGKKHEITPSQVNYRANIAALKMLGCTHILASSAVGSLQEMIKRGDFVILDQFIDFTKQRKMTFFESFEQGVNHTSLANPFSEFLRKKIISSCDELGISFHPFGTVVTIEGPRFSTRAESEMFRAWGADIINMSIATEATLAREAGLEYAAIAMATDYDCWKIDEKPVTWEEVERIMGENTDKMKKLFIRTIEKIGNDDEEFIKSKIRTVPNFPKQGIMFRDITTLLKDPQGFAKAMNLFEERYKNRDIDVIVGIESRGFVLASVLASKLGKSLVLARKPGKLPAETVRQEYDLEYGKDAIEIHKDAIKEGDKVLVIDDLIATGGTMLAACNLVEKLGGKVVECAFIVELPELKGRQKIAQWPIFKLVEFEGE